MKNTYRVPSAALRGEVVSSTLSGKPLSDTESASPIRGQVGGGAGLSFGL